MLWKKIFGVGAVLAIVVILLVAIVSVEWFTSSDESLDTIGISCILTQEDPFMLPVVGKAGVRSCEHFVESKASEVKSVTPCERLKVALVMAKIGRYNEAVAIIRDLRRKSEIRAVDILLVEAEIRRYFDREGAIQMARLASKGAEENSELEWLADLKLQSLRRSPDKAETRRLVGAAESFFGSTRMIFLARDLDATTLQLGLASEETSEMTRPFGFEPMCRTARGFLLELEAKSPDGGGSLGVRQEDLGFLVNNIAYLLAFSESKVEDEKACLELSRVLSPSPNHGTNATGDHLQSMFEVSIELVSGSCRREDVANAYTNRGYFYHIRALQSVKEQDKKIYLERASADYAKAEELLTGMDHSRLKCALWGNIGELIWAGGQYAPPSLKDRSNQRAEENSTELAESYIRLAWEECCREGDSDGLKYLRDDVLPLFGMEEPPLCY